MAFESINLNLIPTGDAPVIHAAQYDIDRPLIINMFLGEDTFTPTDLDIELQVRKVDNNIVTAVPDTVDGNTITFLTTEQMTACSGSNLCSLKFTQDDSVIATLHFFLVVQRDVLQGGLTSQSEIHDLEEQIAEIVPSVIGDEYYTADQVDEKIAEIPTFDPTNYYTKSQLYTKTETNGLLSAKANTSALSTVAFSGSYTDLLNKPTIPDVSNYYTKSETYNQTEVNNLLSTKADTTSLSTVATTGDYDDLLNKPTIPAAQVQSDWTQADNTKVDYIKNKPSLSTVATSGSYNDLTDKPTIPTNAEQLPIESGSATNTKDYIDNQFTKTEITSSCTFDEDITGTNTRIYVKGGVVYIFYQGESKTHSANDSLFTLPSGYRPSNLIYTTFGINNTGYGNIAINNTGAVYVSQVANGGTAGRIYFACAFPI